METCESLAKDFTMTVQDVMDLQGGHTFESWRREQEEHGWPDRRWEETPDADPLRHFIDDKKQKWGLESNAAMSRKCGLTEYGLRDFMAGNKNLFNLVTLQSLANATNKSVEELIELQGGYASESWKGRQEGHEESPEAIANRMARADERNVATRKRSQLRRLRELSEDENAEPALRWICRGMVARDMGHRELAEALGFTEKHVGDVFLKGRKTPAAKTVGQLEELFGLMPADIKLSLRQERSAKSGGRTSQRRFKAMVKNWLRERLEEKIKGLFDGRIPQEIRKEIATQRIEYQKRVGLPGYEVFMKARGMALSAAFPDPPHGPRTGPRVKTPAGHLRQILSGLERRRTTKFYQCQNCRQLWMLNTTKKRGKLCDPCWQPYLRTYNSWRMTGMRNGADVAQDTKPPRMPRAAGGRIIKPAEVQKRIIRLLQFRVLGEGPDSLVSNEYKQLSDTERRLRESKHPWCQGVVQLLDRL